MRKAVIIALVLALGTIPGSAKHCKPMIGGGIGFNYMHTSTDYGSDSDAGLTLSLEGMIPVYNSLYARANILGLRVGDDTFFELGTGSAFDLVYFIPSKNFEPYGLGGLRIESLSSGGSSSTAFSIAFGGGAQMPLKTMPFKPFGEMGISIVVAGGSYDYTTFGISMAFGARFAK